MKLNPLQFPDSFVNFFGPILKGLKPSLESLSKRRKAAVHIRRKVLENEDLRGRIRGGWYASTGQLLFRLGSRLPRHLYLTVLRAGNCNSWLLSARFIAAALAGVPIKGCSFKNDCASLVFKASASSDLILMSPRSGWLIRASEKQIYTEDYCAKRSTLQRQIPMPDFHVMNSGTELHECLVDGVSLELINADEKIAVVQKLLNSFLSSVAENMSDDKIDPYFHDAVRRILTMDIPVSLASLITNSQFYILFGNGPLVLTNEDVHGRNVIVAKGGPFVIDWPATALKSYPFWWASLRLCATAAPLQLVAGRFDEHFDSLWSVAGVREVQPSTHRTLLCAAAAIWGSTWPAFFENQFANLNEELIKKWWLKWGAKTGAKSLGA